MSRFKLHSFDPIHSEISEFAQSRITRLHSLTWMARNHLRGFTSEEVLLLEEFVEQSISEQRQGYVAHELDCYVAGLLEHGGWELGYLPHPEEAGEREIRDLLASWPADADDRPSLASEDDLSEVDALELAIEEALPAVPAFVGDLEKLTHPAKAAAVLALMLIAEALGWLEEHKHGPAHIQGDLLFVGLQAAAEKAIEATLALGLADRLRHEVKLRERLSKQQQEALRLQRNELTRERARHLAERRHSTGNQARAWVVAEWQAHRDGYAGNKSAFARDYVARLRNERGLNVTEKQLREVWLKNPPLASKPAGVRADRE